MTDPAIVLVFVVATCAGGAVATVAVVDGGARIRPGVGFRRLVPPSWGMRVIAVAGLIVALGYAAPAPATMPPPVLRLDAGWTSLAEPVPAAAPSEAALPSGAAHVVARGDTLWDIAASALRAKGKVPSSSDVARYWPALYDLNRAVIGPDPNLILPGQRLVLPQEP